MQDFNGKNENETIRRYDALDEIPVHKLEELELTAEALPVFELIVNGDSQGFYESLAETLAAA